MNKEITTIAVIESTDDKTLNNLLSRIQAEFLCYVDDQTNTFRYELEFIADGTSPIDRLNTIIKEYTVPDLYVQLIIYELPSEYLEHHIYRNGIWTDKINNPLKTQ